MGFKFRLATSLRLAKQEMEIRQGVLANDLRVLQELTVKMKMQETLLTQAWEGQRRACLENPSELGYWQKYSAEQQQILIDCQHEVNHQAQVVEESRMNLMESKIKLEKFKRLKEKKLKLYDIEQLRKEQATIDEIAQSRTSWR